jgi:tRNA A-37 threonylcarbamoyl transferase component Bud32
LGLKLIHVGSGAFRSVYRIKNTNLVIKFPDLYEYGEDHSRDEVRTIKKLYKYKVLRSYLPKIFYFDHRSSVIVMEYYDKYNDRKAGNPHPMRTYGDITWERVLIIELIAKLTGAYFGDLYNINLRLDKNKHVKFVDMGC